MLPKALRTTAPHIGIVVGTMTYVFLGANLFLYLEHPNEIASRQYHLANYEKIKYKFLETVAAKNLTEDEFHVLLDRYIEELFDFYKDSQAARVFEAHYLDRGMEEDRWTLASSILFAATTVIPVGYGFVAPVTKAGRFIVVVYALIGAPLIIVTLSDIGKFLSFYMMRFLPEAVTGICFLALLLAYLFAGALLFSFFANITYLEAAYFSITSVFTIGYGDTQPPVPVPYLILYIIIGVILVTVTMEILAAEAINHIHYMGRHFGKAKKIALKIAQTMDVRRGLALGFTQMESLIRFGLMFDPLRTKAAGEQRNTLALYGINVAFTPRDQDIEFVDVSPKRLFRTVTESTEVTSGATRLSYSKTS